MRKNTVRICLVLFFLSLPALAWAQPRAAICLASSFIGNEIVNDGNVRASNSIEHADALVLNSYVTKGRDRISETLWNVASAPQIIFLDGKKVFGLFDYNKYGSAITLPNKSCVLIGPKGANIDVVSHELVHADIAHMLGYLKNLRLPSWINEGVAMQVDFREKYDIKALNGANAIFVSKIYNGEFYDNDTSDVVANYAAAKHLVSRWIEENGADNLLSIIKNGKLDTLSPL